MAVTGWIYLLTALLSLRLNVAHSEYWSKQFFSVKLLISWRPDSGCVTGTFHRKVNFSTDSWLWAHSVSVLSLTELYTVHIRWIWKTWTVVIWIVVLRYVLYLCKNVFNIKLNGITQDLPCNFDVVFPVYNLFNCLRLCVRNPPPSWYYLHLLHISNKRYYDKQFMTRLLQLYFSQYHRGVDSETDT